MASYGISNIEYLFAGDDYVAPDPDPDPDPDPGVFHALFTETF